MTIRQRVVDADLPKWDPPSPRSVKATWSGSRYTVKPPSDGLARLLVIPDTQVHYRLIANSKRTWDLDPIHDLKAMATAVAFNRFLKPDRAVMVGDGMDAPQFGRFLQESVTAEGFNAALEDMHAFLAALSMTTEVDYIEGNHDLRLATWALANARAAYGVKRAVDTHSAWPVMSVPFLLSLEELGVTYYTGYPANFIDYAPRLRAIHGAKVKPDSMFMDEGGGRCIVHGHLHWVYHRHFRFQGDGEPVESWIANPGCLCRTDGAVPGVASGQDMRTRRPVDKAQSWHQGLGVVTYDPEDPSYLPRWEHVPIVDGVARWRDYEIEGTLTYDTERTPIF